MVHAPQPFEPFWQERMPPLAHSMTPTVQALVQQAPALQAPLVQVVDDAWKRQPFPSIWHMTTEALPVEHALPTAVQTGSVVHVHLAVTDGPVQARCAPQDISLPHAPLEAHVCRSVPEHLVWPV